jgi:hypothetical protein
MVVGGKLDYEVSHIHLSAIPLQPETELLLPDAKF